MFGSKKTMKGLISGFTAQAQEILKEQTKLQAAAQKEMEKQAELVVEAQAEIDSANAFIAGFANLAKPIVEEK